MDSQAANEQHKTKEETSEHVENIFTTACDTIEYHLITGKDILDLATNRGREGQKTMKGLSETRKCF